MLALNHSACGSVALY